jgi:hypothetical protein
MGDEIAIDPMVDEDRVEMGVDNQEIVLAFQSEGLRRYGDFAIV